MSELQDNVALAFRQWNEQREQIAALEARNQQLREALSNLRGAFVSIVAPVDPNNYSRYREAKAALAATEEKEKA